MKTLRLLLVALLFAGTASAQHHGRKAMRGDYSPTVYLVSLHQTDTIYYSPGAVQKAVALNNQAMNNAIQDYLETHRSGFQQTEKPQFIFTTKNNRFSLALGGFVQMRAGADVDGIVDNLDFVPYDIPTVATYDTHKQLIMDASTSRLFFKAITNSDMLGRVVVYMDADFRGGAPGSYTPRLRSAYVSMLGFTLGRDVTTFCDLTAAPTTIDFQGPNAYNFNFATMIRYEVSFARDKMTFGIAAEMPQVSGSYNDYFTPVKQRIPDFPAYLQFAWGPNRESHIRASGVVRNMYLHNMRTGSNTSLLGWGVQFSGTIKTCRWMQLFMNGVYGEGITPYIQDLTGSGLDFTPNPENAAQIQTMPMWGWQAAAQFNLSPRLFLSGGYSVVNVEKKNGFYADDEYKRGQYVFGNIFYALSPRCRVAAEYLYGTRKDMNNAEGHANRAQVMVQYNF